MVQTFFGDQRPKTFLTKNFTQKNTNSIILDLLFKNKYLLGVSITLIKSVSLYV